jgi:hypothetical protein
MQSDGFFDFISWVLGFKTKVIFSITCMDSGYFELLGYLSYFPARSYSTSF